MRNQFTCAVMPGIPGKDISAVFRDWEIALVEVLDLMLERYEQQPGYPFIDMKFNTITGHDFPVLDDLEKDFKSRNVVFGWIQGRALEALAGHAKWLRDCNILDNASKNWRIKRIEKILQEVFSNLEEIRMRNHGRLFFTMTPEGTPFEIDDNGKRREISLVEKPTGFTDLFYVKGMMAAASCLNDRKAKFAAADMLRKVCAEIESGHFVSDQVSFDPKNRVKPISGKLSQTPRMIAVSACALFAGLTGGQEWFDTGRRFINYILDHHIACSPQCGPLRQYDFWEFIHLDGSQWVENGVLSSIPGHTLEFIGFSADLLLQMRGKSGFTEDEKTFVHRCRMVLPGIFMRNFKNGFNPHAGGICKEFDLLNRKPLNDDMPWWSSPEAIRAAGALLALYPEEILNKDIYAAWAATNNGFFNKYINQNFRLVAYQTINSRGKPVDVIPATPDADPCYHTGLSIIDFLYSRRLWP
ncbi:MAG: AGE family epimerase/isomerase [Victivallaceae bacterium]